MLRRLLFVASVVVFVDIAFFTAITPLLPRYAEDLDLGKDAAGLLTASYAIGTLLASLPAGALAARVGPRPAVLGGLFLLGGSSLVFGFAERIEVLDLARFGQGVGSALTWAGAITWLMVSAPADRRGELIGAALGAAVAGALLGPLIGGLAEAVGTQAVFGSVTLISAGLAALTMTLPVPRALDASTLSDALAGMRRSPVAVASLLVALPSAVFGMLAVLIPLRIDELGGSSAVIAGGYAAGALIEAILAPLTGRLSDRRGRRVPIAAGFAISLAAVLIVPPAASVPVLVVALIVASVGGGFCFAPAMARLTDSAEAVGLHQGYAAGVLNMAWASGQISGSAGGGAVAHAVGDALPCIAGAVILAVGIAVLAREGGWVTRAA